MPSKSSPLSEQTINRLFYIIFSIVCCWLLACAWLIEGEYGDGYATIVNSKFLFADAQNYYSIRGPLAAIMLWPVEVALQLFNVSDFSIVPYHFYSAIFHGLYLLGCWLILRRLYGCNSASLLAFIAAILTVVFVAYSPYLSHDIVPGAIFLLMILGVHRWLSVQTLGWAMLVVFLGAMVTLFKQTYAIFWISIVFSVFILLLTKKAPELLDARKLAGLLLLAGISAVISWLGYGFFGQWDFPEESIWTRPVSIIQGVFGNYSAETKQNEGSWSEIFPWYIYWINIQNYGISAMLLVVSGLYLALRGFGTLKGHSTVKERDSINGNKVSEDGTTNENSEISSTIKSHSTALFMLAICWLFCFIFVLLLSAREVRYLGFLAPLTMVLIVPTIQKILQFKRLYILLFTAVLLLDVSRSITLGIGYLTNAGSMQMQKFFSPVNKIPPERRLLTSRILNFPFLMKSPLWQDRYHGIYHLDYIQLLAFYDKIINLGMVKNLGELNTNNMKPGDVLFFSNDMLVRSPPWTKDNQPSDMKNFFQVSGIAQNIELEKAHNGFQIISPKNQLFLLLNDTESNEFNEINIITNNYLELSVAKRYYGEKARQKSFKVAAVVITSLCQARHCQSLE